MGRGAEDSSGSGHSWFGTKIFRSSSTFCSDLYNLFLRSPLNIVYIENHDYHLRKTSNRRIREHAGICFSSELLGTLLELIPAKFPSKTQSLIVIVLSPVVLYMAPPLAALFRSKIHLVFPAGPGSSGEPWYHAEPEKTRVKRDLGCHRSTHT